MIQYSLKKGGYMVNRCGLSIDNRLSLRFKKDGKAVIVKKDNINSPVVCLDKTVSWLEEIPQKRIIKGVVKLVSFSLLPSDKVYFIEEILIDMNEDKCLKSLIALTKGRPTRLYKDVYKYRDLDNKLCLLNLRTKSLTRIENNIRDKFKSIGLEVTSVKLYNIGNNPEFYELVIELGQLEVLHIVLRIDNEIDNGYEVSNTIYSEYFNGLEFNVSNNFLTNEFISGDIFFDSLIKHPLCAIELPKGKTKIFDDNSNVKTNIRTRIMVNSLGKKETD